MSADVYTRFAYHLAKNDIDIDTVDIRAMLVTGSYSFNADHDYVADVVANEINATGYARIALTGEAVALDDSNNRWTFDANDIAFGAIGGAVNSTTGSLILYAQVTNDSDHILVARYDFVVTTNGGTVTATVNSIGLLKGPV